MSDPRERRAYLRRKTQFALKVRSVHTRAGEAIDPKAARFVGTDIGAGGLGIETLLELKEGYGMMLELQLPGVAPIRATAVVQSVSVEERGSKRVYRAGLKFAQISDKDKAAVGNFAKGGGFMV